MFGQYANDDYKKQNKKFTDNTFYYKSFIKVISKVRYFILIGSLYISQLDFS